VTSFFHHAAVAALPVAVALLAGAGIARAAVFHPVARTYLEPLSTWTVLAAIVYALALVASGDAGLILALPLGLALAAVALRAVPEPDDEPSEAPPAPAAPTPAASPPPAAGRLWSRLRAD
jgi:hypothetical protein